MRWVLLFCAFTQVSSAATIDFDYSRFGGNFLMNITKNMCNTKAEVIFDGPRMVMLKSCVNKTETRMRVFICENDDRTPKCKVDTSIKQEGCEKIQAQFMASGDFFLSYPCSNEVYLFRRDPSKPAPVVNIGANTQTEAKTKDEQQPDKTEQLEKKEEGRFD